MAYYIESQTGRRIEDPTQADPSKSYVESGTGKTIQGSQLKGSLPSVGSTAQPTVPEYKSGLVGFSDALEGAVRLAKQKRNELGLTTLKGVLPTNVNLRSTDFSGVLSALNQASDTYSEDLLKNAAKIATPTFDTISAGGDVYQVQRDPTTKQIIGKPEKILSGESSSGGTVNSGGLKVSSKDIGEGAAALDASRGADGWADSALYKKMYDHWVSKDGLAQDFISKFPPDLYINPSDTSLPAYLRSKKASGVNISSSDIQDILNSSR